MRTPNTNPDNLRFGFSHKWVRYIWAAAIISIFILISSFLAPQYGQSWDDEYDSAIGRTALRAYLGYPEYVQQDGVYEFQQRYYGPFFFVLSELIVRLVLGVNQNIHPVDVRHVLNFGSFILSLIAFLDISRRLYPMKISIFLTLLFGSQPVIFGHAFINQKDIPLMSIALWSFNLGIRSFDDLAQLYSSDTTHSHLNVKDRLNQFWRQQFELSAMRRFLTYGVISISSLIILDLVLGLFTLPLIKNAISYAHAGSAWKPFQMIFNVVAEDAFKTPLTLYLDRASRIYHWFRIPLSLLILWLDIFLIKHLIPSNREVLVIPKAYHRLFLAGAILGLAISFRAPVAFICILVVIYALSIMRIRALPPLLLYSFSGLLALYLSWPYLWDAPLTNFIETLQVMSNFPPRQVLYQGMWIRSDNLPWHYLPKLIGLQLTEPISLLSVFAIGILLSKWRTLPNKVLSIVLLTWCAIPISLVMLFRIPIYDNFRQMLFVLPPMFILSGYAINALEHQLSAKWLKLSVAIMILLPGFLGILRLHPYQYSYFNLYAGGTKGAYGRYDLDYWCTSYRGAAQFLNSTAPHNSVVVAAGPDFGLRNFVREDIRVIPDWQGYADPDYVVACDDALFFDFYGNIPELKTIDRHGAVFARIRGTSR